MKAVAFIIFTLAFIAWVVVRLVSYIQFDRNCEGHLKRAADANTVELAAKEVEIAVEYLKSHDMTTGYTSVVYTTPDEDIGFWYTNLTASLDELKKIKADAPQLEKTNVLMKLRETLLDQGEKTHVTCPDGISVYPTNTFWAFFAVIATLGLLAFGIAFLAEHA